MLVWLALQLLVARERKLMSDAENLIFTTENRMILTGPTPQTALDIFQGTWISKLPGEFAHYTAGSTPLFDDIRIPLATQHLGPVKNLDILDLGPLEGGQAYVLEQCGARSVTSVEANAILYLKCLVVKEILGMSRTKFLCGEATEYLKSQSCPRFDVAICSGILYHMEDPIELLRLLSLKTDKLLIWSHYFDPECRERNVIQSFGVTAQREFLGKSHTYHRQEYEGQFDSKVFCGGTARHSNWMERDSILTILCDAGYDDVNIINDGDSPNGPFILLTAQKR
jgi:hypothetical protein